MSEKLTKNQPAKEGELLGSETGNLLNQATVKILIEQNKPDEIKEIMQAELDFNRQRFAIIREHEENHPDAIEARKDKKFRLFQYLYLMFMIPVLLIIIVFTQVQVAIAIALVGIITIICAGIVINGRDRDNDAGILAELVKKFVGKNS